MEQNGLKGTPKAAIIINTRGIVNQGTTHCLRGEHRAALGESKKEPQDNLEHQSSIICILQCTITYFRSDQLLRS